MKARILWIAALMAISAPVSAGTFSLSFNGWGNIPRCTSGFPGTVKSPAFLLSNVPAGTAKRSFRLTDQNVPSFNHGGGKVNYAGKGVIPAGAFTYLSPCPPDGSHSYRWTVTAYDPAGKRLGTASVSKQYP